MRNEMHNFGSTPQANIPRSRFSMPCNVKFTGNTGRLIPFYVAEVLPGDTFDVKTSVVCRLQTLIHPIMDNMYLDTYYFFVPNRLVWDNWQHFAGEPNKAWVPDRDWTVPSLVIGADLSEYDGDNADEQYQNFLAESFKDSVVDYMGIGLTPIAPESGAFGGIGKINDLPIRGYSKIYDDWYRDENLMDPVNIPTFDYDRSMTTKIQWENPLYGGKPYMACKLHDYFTSALPQAQRGNPAELVFGNGKIADVKTDILSHTPGVMPLTGILNNNVYTNQPIRVTQGLTSDQVQSGLLGSKSGVGTDVTGFSPDNLIADLSGFKTGITINDLRMAFQVQKFMERSARGGARYIELIKSMFGVTSPDARLQRSEYLGGHRIPINIHQIVNTTETIETPLGNTGALSVTSDVHEDFIHSFVEHGFVIGICCVRYKHTYPQGMNRFWTRKTKFDYYWPLFAQIGEQPIRNKEIFITGYPAGATSNEQVFAYQEAWADYRYMPNRVMGEMRPGVPNSLASWHLADYYTEQPILSADWIKEDPMPVDRAIAVQSNVADQFLFDILIDNTATRPMPLYSIPGLVDHY